LQIWIVCEKKPDFKKNIGQIGVRVKEISLIYKSALLQTFFGGSEFTAQIYTFGAKYAKSNCISGLFVKKQPI